MIYKNTVSSLNEMRLVIQTEREVEERFFKVLETLPAETKKRIFDDYQESKNGN